LRFLISGSFPETAWRTTHSRQAAHVKNWVFLGCHEGPPGGEALYRQATQTDNYFWVFFDELPDGDEYPPGDASGIGLVLVFCVF